MALELNLEQKKEIMKQIGLPASYIETQEEEDIDGYISEIPEDELKAYLGISAIKGTPAPAEQIKVETQKELKKAVEEEKKKEENGKKKPKAPTVAPSPKTKPAPAKAPSTSVLGLKVVTPSLDFSEAIPKATDEDIASFVDRVSYMKLLDDFRKLRQSVILMGEAGVGKTTMARYYAYKNKLPFFTISVDALLSIREMFGSLHIVGGTSFFVESEFIQFVQIPSVILIDEITALDPSRNFVFHQILAQRRFYVKDSDKHYTLDPQTFVMFAGNPPNVKYTGLTKFNLAFADRMGAILVEPLSRKELDTIFKNSSLSKQDLTGVFNYYDKIRELINTQKLRAEFTLRSLRRIVGFMELGYKPRTAIDLGFLNNIAPFEPKVHDAILSETKAFYGN